MAASSLHYLINTDCVHYCKTKKAISQGFILVLLLTLVSLHLSALSWLALITIAISQSLMFMSYNSLVRCDNIIIPIRRLTTEQQSLIITKTVQSLTPDS